MDQDPDATTGEFTRLVGGLTGSIADTSLSAKALQKLVRNWVPDGETIQKAIPTLVSQIEESSNANFASNIAFVILKLIRASEEAAQAVATWDFLKSVVQLMLRVSKPPETFYWRCLTLCDVVSERIPSIAVDDVSFCSFFCDQGTIGDRDATSQRLAMHVLVNLVNGSTDKKPFTQFVKEVGMFITQYDQTVSHYAVVVFTELAKSVPDDELKDLLEIIDIALLVVTHAQSLCVIFDYLQYVAGLETGREGLFKLTTDFGLVCDICDATGEMVDDVHSSLLRFLDELFRKQQDRLSQSQQKFGDRVGPIIVNMLVAGVRDLDLCVNVLLGVLKFSTPSNIEDVFLGFGEMISRGYIELVDKIVQAMNVVGNIRGYYHESEALIESLKGNESPAAESICNKLREYQRQTDSREFRLDTEITDNVARLRANVNEIIRCGPTNAKSVVSENIISILDQLIASETEVPSNIVTSLISLFEIMIMPLVFRSWAVWRHEGHDFRQFMSQKLPIDVTVDQETRHVELPLSSDFLALELWYNETFCGISRKKLMELDSILSEIVARSTIESATGCTVAMLHRGFKTPGYKRARFVVDGVSFSAYDGLCKAFEYGKKPPYVLEPLSVTIFTIEGPDEPPSTIAPSVAPSPDTVLAFTLLRKIMTIQPDATIPTLRTLVTNYIKYEYLDMNKTDPMWAILNEIDDLLPEDLFVSLVMSTRCRVRQNLRNRCKLFGDSYEFDEKPVHCRIRREQLLTDGIALIEGLGAGNIDYDIELVGETGTGKCAVSEFFEILAQELCKASCRLWCAQPTPSGFVAIPKQGLYLRPDADCRRVQTLGLAMAKAVSMNCAFPIPLQQAFFEVAQYHDAKDVRDSIYTEITDIADMLSDREGLYGLVFEYPGLHIPLCPGGQNMCVDTSNTDEYIQFMKEKILSFDLVQEFVKGFTQVLPRNVLTAFRSRHLTSVFTGMRKPLTMMDLMTYVALDGYGPSSVQVSNLFDFLTKLSPGDVSLFLEFVTGSRYLPLNGLADLKPALTVRFWDTDYEFRCLPAAITCEHTLLLPPYQTPSQLNEKLRIAMQEGREEFLANF